MVHVSVSAASLEHLLEIQNLRYHLRSAAFEAAFEIAAQVICICLSIGEALD